MIALFGAGAAPAMAVPAAPDTIARKQPNGRSFRMRLWGDERLHGWQTAEGYTVLHDKATGYWHYARLGAKGEIEKARERPTLDAPPAGVSVALRPSPQSVSMRRSQMIGMEETPQERAIPGTGTGYCPVMLVNFSDTTTIYNPADFRTLLFGSGVWSMKDYYEEVSYGAFTVAEGPSGIGGWYTAASTHDNYGTNDAIGRDMWPGDLVYEAAQVADTAGYDFAPYDQDGDCLVDNLVIVHQGGGEEFVGAPDTNIWSHSWSLAGAEYFGYSHHGPYTTNSNCAAHPGEKIVVNKYTMQPELYATTSRLTTMGVYAHEFGHALGLPDLYDEDYSSIGVGDWSLMASGSWNRFGGDGGNRPSHIDPWGKWLLGWITPTPVTCASAVSLPSAAISSAGFHRLLDGSAPGVTGEYFLVENRQQTGFDAGLPGAGLLIWHVDEAVDDNTGECYPGGPSCATQHYKVALVQADNLWNFEKGDNEGDAGDSYPGTSNRRIFTGTSSPNSKLHSGAESGAAVTGISDSGPMMTATLQAPGDGTVSVVKAGSGMGTVTSDPSGINCGASCSAAFACGSSVTLTAVAATGSVFTGWSNGCTGAGNCIIAVSLSSTVTATFTLATSHTLSVYKTGTGAGAVTSHPAGIDCGADCGEAYVSGTLVSLTAVPAAGSAFFRWTGACSGMTPTCQVTMNGAKTVTAEFSRFHAPAGLRIGK